MLYILMLGLHLRNCWERECLCLHAPAKRSSCQLQAESSVWLQMSVGSTAPVPSVEDCMMACETGEAAAQGLGLLDLAAQALHCCQ